MHDKDARTAGPSDGDRSAEGSPFRAGAVRYIVADVDRSIAFYEQLGFKVDHYAGPAFAKMSSGPFTLNLSGPKSSGAQPMPDGRRPEPGGWNRILLEVRDLPARVAELKKRSLKFRNEILSGPGGRQILAEDPDGNPIELFEPAAAPADRRQADARD